MMIAPPLAGKTTPLDALLSKTHPRDSESSQPVSFDEVLKDEEKKLKQEQEAAMLIAAVPLQTVALPAAPETLPPADGESAPEAAQGVQPAAVRVSGVQLGGLASAQAIESLDKQNRAPVQFSSVSAPAGTAQSAPAPQLKPASGTETAAVPVGQAIPLNTQSQAAPVQPIDSISAEVAPAEMKMQAVASQVQQADVVTPRQEVPVKEAQPQPVTESEIKPAEMKTQVVALQAEQAEVVTPKQEVPVKETQSRPVTASEIKPADIKAQAESQQTEQVEVVSPKQEVPAKEAQSQPVTASEIKSADMRMQAITSQVQQADVVTPKQEVPAKEAQPQPVTASEIKSAEMKMQAVASQVEQADVVTPKQEVPVNEAQPQSVTASEIKPSEMKMQAVASQVEQADVVIPKQEVPAKEAQPQPIQSIESDTTINPEPVKKSVVAAQYSAPQFENAAAQSPMPAAESGLFTAKVVAPEPIEASQDAASQLTDPSVVIQSTMRDTAAAVRDSASFVQTLQPAVQPSEVIGQIMGQMKVRIKSGPGTMRLQLNPQELGAIEVQVVRNAQGISVTFSAEQPGTGRILEAQADQLRQALKDAGVQLNGLNISQQNHHPRQEGGSLKQAPYFGPYAAQDQSSAEKASVESNRPARRTGSAGEIDYLI